jgi:diaminopimelate decarboxylase
MRNGSERYRFHFDEAGRFRVEDVGVDELASTYGTPLHIVSKGQLLANLHALQRGLARGWPGDTRVLPAIKSNTSFALCRVLAGETPGCDLFSEGELVAALRGGFDPVCLSLNGNSKLGCDTGLLRTAIARGVRITLDDALELDAIEAIAKELGRRATIRLRVRLLLPKANAPTDFPVHGPLPTAIAAQAYKAGIPYEDLLPVGRRAIGSQNVDLVGVHLHLGRHRSELEFWRDSMTAYARLLADLRRAWNGWEPREIDVGGGFAQHLDPFVGYQAMHATDRQFRTLSRLMTAAGMFGESARYRLVALLLDRERRKIASCPPPDLERSQVPSAEQYAETAAAALRDAMASEGIETADKLLEIEPGRSLFGSAAAHVTRVNFIKRQTQPIPWAWVVTDTSEVWLQGGGHGPRHPCVVDGKPLERYSPARRLVADVAGKSCGPDQILGDVCLPGDLAAGDRLVLVGTGAYQEMMSSNFNSMPRPATVLVDEARHALIRRRETIDDVFDREVDHESVG